MNKRGLLDLIISLLPGLKPVEKINLIQNLYNEEELYLNTRKNIEELLNRKIDNFWEINDIRDKADRIDTICKMRSINWVSWNSADYPPLLREIYDSPSVLFYKGVLPNPEKSLLGMVGTRKPSPDAAAQAYKLAFGAGKAGISVVSGLAIGIDAMSHRGNLVTCAPGYAVLGSGIDEVYPSCNRPLAKRILDSGGSLISEYPPGVRPAKWTFPARNRIISALSRSILLVEAPGKSGALITAAFALEHGRDLWVASSGCQQTDTIYDREGTIKLVQDGAEIIHSPADIFEKWNMIIADNNRNIPVEESGERDIVSFTANLLKIEY
jgi:DNA processing protein